MQEAAFYEKLDEGRVRCGLCPHRCVLAPGKKGICGVRENHGGRLYTLNYARVSSWGFDPVEKKPLYHFCPGTVVFSLGTVGCNFHCEFCQNWEIARGDVGATFELGVEALIEVLTRQAPPHCVGVAYTYSEPSVWYEYVLAASRGVREKGYRNVLVTNGFINPEPLAQLLPYVDALNIDVKSFTDSFYRRVVHGEREPVLRTAIQAKEAGCHVEITTLLVPGLNDGREELEQLVDWIATHLGSDTPLHFSRYFPHYRLRLPPTPVETLRRARELARRKLSFVYLGNVPDAEASTTYCPGCGRPVVERLGYRVSSSGLADGRCRYCGRRLPFVLEPN
ncbi:MAG: AmmeMemoRadiSam system radical SAM enzyme [Clostridia bacterium]|jgi:pyruvate formate lyase activating enzyme|nr:AmmeMemoRadiSam system radical SAM enzyme [Clostridia bacterium]MDH7571966.1 AmmeMemoRadiSam system radical SAM enzyme [Clostridia bacterium]